MKHREVLELLYEYIRGELDENEAHAVSEHLAGCSHCSADERELRELIGGLPPPRENPAGAKDDREWSTFHAGIMERVHRLSVERQKDRRSPFALLRPTFSSRWAKASTLIAVALLLAFFLLPSSRENTDREELSEPIQTPPRQSMERYFRQSRSLLVGLTNMELATGTPVDLTAERALSRELFQQGRSIQQQPIDRGSFQLITDLGVVMEKVAESGEMDRRAEVESIRNEIQGRNLLIKLRMAEAGYTAVSVKRTANSNPGGL